MESVFLRAIQSPQVSHAWRGASIQCLQSAFIVLKGPSGCGKGFLVDWLLRKYTHLVRPAEFDAHEQQDAPFLHDAPRNNGLEAKCTRSLFPSLSFTSSWTSDASVVDNRKLVTLLSDAHFHGRDYGTVRRDIERLKTLQGIVILKATEFDYESSMLPFALRILAEVFPTIQTIALNPCAPTLMKKTLAPMSRLLDDAGLSLNAVIPHFGGDARAFLHDLYLFSLLPDTNHARLRYNVSDNATRQVFNHLIPPLRVISSMQR